GVLTVTNALGFANTIDVSAFTTVVINALGGNDTISIAPSGLFAGGVRVLGGEPGGGSDVVDIDLTATTRDAILDFLTNQVLGVVGGPITLAGVETLDLDGVDGTTDVYTVLNYGAPTDLRTVNLNGGDTNNDDNDQINIGTGPLALRVDYTATGPDSATFTTPGGPALLVAGFNNT